MEKKIIRKLVIFSILFLLTIPLFAGELEHIIRDGEYWYNGIFEERASCVEKEHLFIKLPEEDWNVMCGGDKDFRRDYANWYGEICIKCRLITIACSGNDYYRYIVETERI